ncbi:sensor histidine kinase [Flavitalea antarctica]
MRTIKTLLLLVIVNLSRDRCSAQVIDAAICDSTTRFPVTTYTWYLQTTKEISIDSVLKSGSNFKKSQKTVLAFMYDPYYYWFRIIIKNAPSSRKDLMLLMAPVGMYKGQLFQKINGNWRDVAHTGLKYPFKERAYQFTHHVFPFSLNPNSTDTLYLNIDASNAYKSFGFALLKPKELAMFANKIYFVFGIIEGLLILFFILNIALFFALKERLHLWYALYISLLFLVVLKNDHLEQQFLGLDSELSFRLTPYMTIGALAIAVLMHVAQSFLKGTLIHSKALYRLTVLMKYNVLVAAIVHAFVFFWSHDYRIQSIVWDWARISVFLGICLIIIDCIYCIRRGFPGAYFIFAGSSVFMIGSIQRLYFPSTLSFLFPPTTFHIGIMLETLVISIALIYRYWTEKELQRIKEEQIQTQTLNDISEEIHDNIGQTLALANLNLRTINFENNNSVQLKTDETKALISKAITDLRDLSRAIKTESFARVDLIHQVKLECEELQKPGTFKIDFQSNVETLPIENKKQVIIMRILKGIFQNIIKHSQASKVGVVIFSKPGLLSIQVNDNGIGFNLSDDNLNSNGLKNIRNRCVLLKAECSIESEVSLGTTISIEMPV